MNDGLLADIFRAAGAFSILLLLAWGAYLLIPVISSRFRHEIQASRGDIIRLEAVIDSRDRQMDRLDAEIAELRDRARLDRQQCDEQIARWVQQTIELRHQLAEAFVTIDELRRQLADVTPPHGTPHIGPVGW